jgi:hypothetical protein
MATYRISGLTDCKIQIDNAGTVQELDLYFINEANFEPEMEDIEWSGDGQKITVQSMTALNVELTCDAWDADTIAAVFGVTAVTASLPTGEAKRWYWGTAEHVAGAPCGLVIVCTATDVDTNATKTLEIVAPKGTLSFPSPPAGLANKSTAQLSSTFAAEQTLVDAAGDPLPGVGSDPIFWYLTELS